MRLASFHGRWRQRTSLLYKVGNLVLAIHIATLENVRLGGRLWKPACAWIAEIIRKQDLRLRIDSRWKPAG